MNKEFFESLELLEKEKGIPKEEMMEKVENALLAAFRKENNGNENVRIKLDPEKSDVRMYVQLTVVENVEDPRTQISLEDARLHKKKIQLRRHLRKRNQNQKFRPHRWPDGEAGHYPGHPRGRARPDDPRIRRKEGGAHHRRRAAG